MVCGGTDLIKILCHLPENIERAFSHLKALFCVSQNSSLSPSQENADDTEQNVISVKYVVVVGGEIRDGGRDRQGLSGGQVLLIQGNQKLSVEKGAVVRQL